MLLRLQYSLPFVMRNCNFLLGQKFRFVLKNCLSIRKVIYLTLIAHKKYRQKDFSQICFYLLFFHKLFTIRKRQYLSITLKNINSRLNNNDFQSHNFHQIYYMSELAVSQIEKHFITSSVYKRSKRYFDIAKINHIEHQQQVSRRMPQNSSQTIDSRVGESFISSDELLQGKVSNDLDLFHKKMRPDDADETETAYTARTTRAHSVDMRKMLSRRYLDNLTPSYNNEQQFNNYKTNDIRPRKSLDFNTFIGRNEKNRIKKVGRPQQSQTHANKVGKIQQKLHYDQSNFSCFVDYKKNGRYVQKPIVDQSPSYEPKSLQKAQMLTKKSVFSNQLQFYNGNGKNDPCQFDNRILKQNQYFWRNIRQERERLKDYSVNKRKQEQQLKRIQGILARKKQPHNRQEMCDEKYFRKNIEK